ncbi:HipA-like C-terminal domain [Pseudidiomarina woesei]|uniref:HipA-like C-terminal domain n=1 Tax=Pseudidiomarina woesei TaxID=1381080 RepID=A0A0K6H4B5_9GAMM|nr:HipA-like C-terminal domain [Pseudidiomarina woesei]
MGITSRNILITLRAGPESAKNLALRFGVNVSTMSRQLNKLGDQVIKAAAGRSTLWYAARTIAGVPNQHIPIYRVNRQGHAEQFATLTPVFPEQSYVVKYQRAANDTEWRHYMSLPWWMSDMRPQGFLGRIYAQSLVLRGVVTQADPIKWQEDDVLRVLINEPAEHVGNLLIGEYAYQQWLESQPSASLNRTAIAARADAIAAGEHFDSSAKGEQPKLLATVNKQPSIIKFSGRLHARQSNANAENIVARRWADLLFAEAHAARAMNAVQPAIAAHNTSFETANRVFMQSQRFDRIPPRGRVGVVSLQSLDLEFVGQGQTSWPELTAALCAENVVSEQAQLQATIAWAFGQLIGNTDMHLGNLSVLHEGRRPYQLAPVYDMLPMHYAPNTSGDMKNDVYRPKLNSYVRQVHWLAALAMAHEFWPAVINDSSISEGFREIARQQYAVVQAFAETINRMA